MEYSRYKDSKNIANKMGDTLAELSLPENYDSTFLELKQKEDHKTVYANHPYKENYNKPFLKEEFTRAFQATKISAPGPDKIHNEKLKHFPPEGLDSLHVLHNRTWQQGNFPEKRL